MSVYLSVDRISKKFKTTQAVDQLSFQVERGRIFAFLGPNGAGKSTLVRMLLGLARPDSGTIRYSGLKEGEMPPSSQVGYLPEERGLYLDRTVLENLVYLGRLRGMEKSAAEEKASVWLERFELLERRQEKVDALSKGNQQKVQLIAAILHDPEVAILDEPFAGLDPINQEMMLEVLAELRARGTTVLLSAHQMALVERLADDLLLMSRGRSVLQGPVADVLAQHHQGDGPTSLHDIYINAVRSAGLPDSAAQANEEAAHG
jgi:ABC-2 type transport system ATP-binding protein